jgi:hypothetical protein
MYKKLTTQAVSILGDNVSFACIYSVWDSRESCYNGYSPLYTETTEHNNALLSEVEGLIKPIEDICVKTEVVAEEITAG